MGQSFRGPRAVSAGSVAKTHAATGVACGPPLSAAGGVAIDGIDLSQPLPATAKDLILAAFREHQVVVFHDQTLTREQQFTFAAGFGEVEAPVARSSGTKRYAVAHVLSNLDGDGNPVDRSGLPVSNYNWHTDKPYYSAPPMMTTLYAVELPPQGGDTEFANTAMAYAALPAAESSALLARLLAHATQPRFVYAHRWRVGDLVMWDNRCLLHRAVANFELSKHRRIMHRSVLRGTVPY